MSKNELFQCFKRGWHHGCRAAVPDARFTEHGDPRFVDQYNRGYEAGRAQTTLVLAKECERLDYDPKLSILRAAETSI